MRELTFRRDLRETDREAIAAILRSSGAFREQEVLVGLELLEETLNPRPETDYLWLVAEDRSSRIHGFVCFGAVPMTEGTFDLYWIVVAREARGRGVATSLESQVVERVRSMGGRWLLAETSSQATFLSARRFYEKTGYSLLETIPDFYREGNDRLTYGKRVDRADP